MNQARENKHRIVSKGQCLQAQGKRIGLSVLSVATEDQDMPSEQLVRPVEDREP